MGELEDDLKEWIHRLEAHLAGRKTGSDFRTTEIEKLADQWEKRGAQVEASWIRQSTSINHIGYTISQCRAYIELGEIEKAYSIHKDFERNRSLIKALLDQQHIKRGRKVSHDLPGSNKGGQKRGTTTARDVRLAKQFQEQFPKSKMSPTAMKQKIGKAAGLGRSQSVEAVNRGLKKLSGEPG